MTPRSAASVRTSARCARPARQVDRFAPLGGAAEGQHAGHDRVEPGDLLDQPRDQRRALGRAALDAGRVQAQRVERVADLVRHAADELPERGQPFGPAALVLGPRARRGHRGDRPGDRAELAAQPGDRGVAAVAQARDAAQQTSQVAPHRRQEQRAQRDERERGERRRDGQAAFERDAGLRRERALHRPGDGRAAAHGQRDHHGVHTPFAQHRGGLGVRARRARRERRDGRRIAARHRAGEAAAGAPERALDVVVGAQHVGRDSARQRGERAIRQPARRLGRQRPDVARVGLGQVRRDAVERLRRARFERNAPRVHRQRQRARAEQERRDRQRDQRPERALERHRAALQRDGAVVARALAALRAARGRGGVWSRCGARRGCRRSRACARSARRRAVRRAARACGCGRASRRSRRSARAARRAGTRAAAPRRAACAPSAPPARARRSSRPGPRRARRRAPAAAASRPARRWRGTPLAAGRAPRRCAAAPAAAARARRPAPARAAAPPRTRRPRSRPSGAISSAGQAPGSSATLQPPPAARLKISSGRANATGGANVAQRVAVERGQPGERAPQRFRVAPGVRRDARDAAVGERFDVRAQRLDVGVEHAFGAGLQQQPFAQIARADAGRLAGLHRAQRALDVGRQRAGQRAERVERLAQVAVAVEAADDRRRRPPHRRRELARGELRGEVLAQARPVGDARDRLAVEAALAALQPGVRARSRSTYASSASTSSGSSVANVTSAGATRSSVRSASATFTAAPSAARLARRHGQGAGTGRTRAAAAGAAAASGRRHPSAGSSAIAACRAARASVSARRAPPSAERGSLAARALRASSKRRGPGRAAWPRRRARRSRPSSRASWRRGRGGARRGRRRTPAARETPAPAARAPASRSAVEDSGGARRRGRFVVPRAARQARQAVPDRKPRRLSRAGMRTLGHVQDEHEGPLRPQRVGGRRAELVGRGGVARGEADPGPLDQGPGQVAEAAGRRLGAQPGLQAVQAHLDHPHDARGRRGRGGPAALRGERRQQGARASIAQVLQQRTCPSGKSLLAVFRSA